ncbi:hypothetical protein SLE2022_371100 [Rubroshorea leprosula]
MEVVWSMIMMLFSGRRLGNNHIHLGGDSFWRLSDSGFHGGWTREISYCDYNLQSCQGRQSLRKAREANF